MAKPYNFFHVKVHIKQNKNVITECFKLHNFGEKMSHDFKSTIPTEFMLQ